MSSDIHDWSKSEGKEVQVSGTAVNAKAGALLMTGPEDAILIRGLSEWDAAIIGKKVSVQAIVRRLPGYPAADESDELMQGTASGRETWVLELKQYQVVG